MEVDATKGADNGDVHDAWSQVHRSDWFNGGIHYERQKPGALSKSGVFHGLELYW